MRTIHQDQALHRGEYGWLLCSILWNMEELIKDAFFFKALRCLLILPLEKPVPFLLHFDTLSPWWMQAKNAEHANLPQLNLRGEAGFVFISAERESCGWSCCNMVMLPFHWPLYWTSSHDPNQSKLCSDRLCCFCWEPFSLLPTLQSRWRRLQSCAVDISLQSYFFSEEKITFFLIYFFPLQQICLIYSVIIKLIFGWTMLSPNIVLWGLTDGCVQAVPANCNESGGEELIPCISPCFIYLI